MLGAQSKPNFIVIFADGLLQTPGQRPQLMRLRGGGLRYDRVIEPATVR